MCAGIHLNAVVFESCHLYKPFFYLWNLAHILCIIIQRHLEMQPWSQGHHYWVHFTLTLPGKILHIDQLHLCFMTWISAPSSKSTVHCLAFKTWLVCPVYIGCLSPCVMSAEITWFYSFRLHNTVMLHISNYQILNQSKIIPQLQTKQGLRWRSHPLVY